MMKADDISSLAADTEVSWSEADLPSFQEMSSRSGLPERLPPAAYTKKLPIASEVFVVDFFAGCGGMSYGFANTRQSHANFNVLAGVDISSEALKTYAANIPGASPIQADVFELAEDPELLRTLVPAFDPELCRPLVFIGCAPCQGFSAHRKKDNRVDRRNSLMLAFARLCGHYKPDVIVMENVPEILGGRYAQFYAEAKESLEKSGYSISQEVLDLSLFGVPQRRRRAIILGSLRGGIRLPKPIFNRDTAPTVRQAIQHLAPINAGETDPHDPFHRAPAHIPRVLDRIRKTPADGGDRRSLSEVDQLECHTAVDEGSAPGFTDVYGRLRWDAPSVTITAKSSTPSCGRFLHPEQHRNISVREAAILQGFPQSFRFEGGFVNQYRQIGEAVPPLFARALAWSVLDHVSPASSVQSLQARRIPAGVHTRALRIVDGFSGAGGIALGFQMAGYSTAFAFDVDSDAVSTFAQNISDRARQLDVRDETLPVSILESVGSDTFVLAGGPPCQGFSQQRRGSDFDPRNNLVNSFADVVAKLKNRPIAIVLENVTYLDSPRGREVFERYQAQLRDLGYVLYRHDMNSADFGVPQLRKRILSVAVSHQIANQYRGPSPSTPHRWPTVGEALAGLPSPIRDPGLLKNHEPSGEGSLNKRRLAYVDMGKGRMSIPLDLQLPCHVKYGGHLDVFGRLDWYSQARTITGGFDSFTRGEFGHPFDHRSITAREAARIQGFPDWFEFVGNRASVRRQIGNAVPPSVAEAVARAIHDAVSRANA